MGKIIQLIHGNGVNGEVLYALDDEGNIYRSEENPSTFTQGTIKWIKVTPPDSN